MHLLQKNWLIHRENNSIEDVFLTHDPTTKIQWLKKLDNQELFQVDAIIFDSEQYEIIEQSQEKQYSNNILSKPLIIPEINRKHSGQYICLIQNDKATNYKKAFIDIEKSKNLINCFVFKDFFLFQV